MLGLVLLMHVPLLSFAHASTSFIASTMMLVLQQNSLLLSDQVVKMS